MIDKEERNSIQNIFNQSETGDNNIRKPINKVGDKKLNSEVEELSENIRREKVLSPFRPGQKIWEQKKNTLTIDEDKVDLAITSLNKPVVDNSKNIEQDIFDQFFSSKIKKELQNQNENEENDDEEEYKEELEKNKELWDYEMEDNNDESIDSSIYFPKITSTRDFILENEEDRDLLDLDTINSMINDLSKSENEFLETYVNFSRYDRLESRNRYSRVGTSNSLDDEETNEMIDDFDRPALEIYGTNLTELARAGALEECFGREKELSELMEILVRRQKNNPVLMGDAGVGKTAIVELFATKLVRNQVPFVLDGRSLINVDLARIVGGSRYRGEFELRFQRLLDEVLQDPTIIVFIDEIHNISGTGSAEGSLDAANILKPVLSRSGFQCIGSTTTKEYQKIEKDPALNRRFQPIKVKEPTIEETVYILYGLRSSFESFHNLEILPSALRAAAELSSRYIQDRFLPDKAIDLIDRAAARAVVKLTDLREKSILGAIVNSALSKIGRLRHESFRKGDIASEFVFQEVENAYRNFLISWIESPEAVIEQKEKIANPLVAHRATYSPLSEKLYEEMQEVVLAGVDRILFSSYKSKETFQNRMKTENLSPEQNSFIYEKISEKLKQGKDLDISLYRSCLAFFIQWINFTARNVKPISSPGSLKNLKIYYHQSGFISYLNQIREFNLINLNHFEKIIPDDFLSEDEEAFEAMYEGLSELEEQKIEIFESFLEKLKPTIRNGLIEANVVSGDMSLTPEEMKMIYQLLGFYSTNTGKNFLKNLNEPNVLTEARFSGDFTSLKSRITDKDIQDLLSGITGIPLQSLTSDESEKLLNLETILHQRVIGQDDAISAIARAIRRSRLGIQNPNRPIASFLFCGPTGVGKTEVTKALAVTLFGSEKDMIRFDMSEFMEKFAISRLIGSPPGYVGYDEGGELTDAVRRRPYSVVLFDEVEKAHPDVLNILLQILEDGRLTDSQRRLVDFDNTVIIMTSNAAAGEIQQIMKNHQEIEENVESLDSFANKNKTILISDSNESTSKLVDEYSGVIEFFKSPIKENYFADLHKQIVVEFEKSLLHQEDYNLYKKIDSDKLSKETVLQQKEDNFKRDKQKKQEEVMLTLKSQVLEALTVMFLPEFLNRLDDIVIFQPLRPDELRKICDLMVQSVIDRMKTKGINLTVDDPVKLKLTREGYNPMFGARPLRRLVTKYIEDLLSETMLKSPDLKQNKKLRVYLNEENEIRIREVKKEIIVV